MTRPEIENEEFRNGTETRVIHSLRTTGVVSSIGEIARHPETLYPKDGTRVVKTEVPVVLQEGASEDTLLSEIEHGIMRFPGRITTFERDGNVFNRVDVLLLPNIEAEL